MPGAFFSARERRRPPASSCAARNVDRDRSRHRCRSRGCGVAEPTATREGKRRAALMTGRGSTTRDRNQNEDSRPCAGRHGVALSGASRVSAMPPAEIDDTRAMPRLVARKRLAWTCMTRQQALASPVVPRPSERPQPWSRARYHRALSGPPRALTAGPRALF